MDGLLRHLRGSRVERGSGSLDPVALATPSAQAVDPRANRIPEAHRPRRTGARRDSYRPTRSTLVVRCSLPRRQDRHAPGLLRPTRTDPPIDLTLEPPGADPHARWCRRGARVIPGSPILIGYRCRGVQVSSTAARRRRRTSKPITAKPSRACDDDEDDRQPQPPPGDSTPPSVPASGAPGDGVPRSHSART